MNKSRLALQETSVDIPVGALEQLGLEEKGSDDDNDSEGSLFDFEQVAFLA